MEYARIAQTWFAGDGYLGILGGLDVNFPPLYPALIGVVSLIVRDAELAARIISLVGGLILVATIYFITRRLFGAREGLIAGVVASTHPVLVALSVSTYCESLTFCLVMLSLLSAIHAGSSARALLAVASGAAIGFAYLVRPEMIVFAAVVAGFLAYSARKHGRRWGPTLRFAALPLVTAVVIAVPNVVYLSRLAGYFCWEGKTAINELKNDRMTSGMSYPRSARGLDVEDDFASKAPYLGGTDLWPDQSVFFRLARRRGPADAIVAIPKRIPGVVRLIKWAILQWTSLWKIPVGVIAIIAGLVCSRWWRREERAEVVLLMTFGALHASFPLALRLFWSRYAFPVVPFWIPWLAAGVVWLCAAGLGWWNRLAGTHHDDRWTTVASVTLAVVLSAGVIRRVAMLDDFHQALDSAIKGAGLWIRGQPRPADRSTARPLIMGHGAALPFYADGVLAYLPSTDKEQVALRFVHWKAPDYVALRSSEVAQSPYFDSWLSRGIPDDCAVPIRRIEAESGLIRIWRWDCRH